MYFYLLCLDFPCLFNLKNLFVFIKSGKLSTVVIMNTVSFPLSLFPLFGILIRDNSWPLHKWGLWVLTLHAVENSCLTLLKTPGSASKDSRSFRLCSTIVCIYGKKSIYKPTAQFKSVLFKGWTEVEFFQSPFRVFYLVFSISCLLI